MRALALAVILATAPGCAWFASANAAHSHISPCVSDPTYAAVDLVLAAGVTAGLGAGGALDDSAAYMLIPAVFVTSGVLGAIYAHKCAQRDKATPPAPGSVPVPYTFEPTQLEPTQQPRNPDDPPEQTLIDPTQPIVRLRLDPTTYELKDPPRADAKTDDKTDDKIKCGITMGVTCPEKFSCLIVENNQGYCVPD